jgi:MGT family glycosyltransferase
LAVSPIRNKINSYRRKWALKPLRSLYETFSPILELAQQTSDFDFPRQSPPPQLHYIGLIRRSTSANIAFPFDRLDGRPLVYGSLGTVAVDTKGIFRMLADACAQLPVQLVITLGGTGDTSQYADLPGDPIVVNYAPQMAILGRAAATVCHAGNNTVLESLACGVPVVAVPLNTDQYGVAARLAHCGAGERISLGQLNARRLYELLERILSQASYTERARTIRDSLDRAGGERRAADLVEQTLAR